MKKQKLRKRRGKSLDRFGSRAYVISAAVQDFFFGPFFWMGKLYFQINLKSFQGCSQISD